MRFSKTAGGHSIPYFLVIVVETTHKTNLQFDTSSFNLIQHLLDDIYVSMNGLFTENVFPSSSRCNNKISVSIS